MMELQTVQQFGVPDWPLLRAALADELGHPILSVFQEARWSAWTARRGVAFMGFLLDGR
jgi:hypothetical protein